MVYGLKQTFVLLLFKLLLYLGGVGLWVGVEWLLHEVHCYLTSCYIKFRVCTLK